MTGEIMKMIKVLYILSGLSLGLPMVSGSDHIVGTPPISVAFPEHGIIQSIAASPLTHKVALGAVIVVSIPITVAVLKKALPFVRDKFFETRLGALILLGFFAGRGVFRY